MEFPPTLTALYSIGYRLPGYSGGWGDWKWMDGSPKYQHNPDLLLANGEHDIASISMPVIGPYDSSDPDLCEYHILLAKAAGLDGFVIDWNPENEPAQKALQLFFRMAEKLDFKLSLQLYESDRQSTAEANIGFAAKHFFTSPAYLRHLEKPILNLAGTRAVSGTLDWKKICADAGVHVTFLRAFQPGRPMVLNEGEGLYPDASVFWGEADSNEEYWAMVENKSRSLPFVAGSVNPGYDDRGSRQEEQPPRVCSRRQGEKYSATWEDNLRHDARFIQISTWNQHHEGSAVEPVKESILHKTAAVPGWGYRELITTREYALQLRQKKLWPLPALFLPERLYRLRKNGAPESRGDRIRLYLLEGDITGATLGLEQAGV
jgi:hypothetical protein